MRSGWTEIDQNGSVETLLIAVDSKCCVHRMTEEVEEDNWYETEEGNNFWDQFSSSEQICDTGSSAHASGQKYDMIKLREIIYGNHITSMNRKQEQSTMIAKIPGTVCNEYDNEIKKETINEVTHVPISQYNLFSATKLILQNYNMV
eukprot:5410739-Ditylum_brightwellii.AAC.1